MKEFIFKKGKILNFLVSFIVIIFFSMLLITSKNSVAKEENQELSVELQNNVDITLSNYSNYFIDDANKGVITKFNVKIGVNNIETANIPINETVALIQLPKIEDKYPESVKLISRGTKLTNGKTYNTGENYEYNESTGQIYIRTTNIADENENKYINSIAGNIDEYDIISKYTGDMYNDSNVERKLNIISAVQCVLADKENTKIETRYENNFDVSKNIHNLIYTQTQTQKIYNGYIFANINHDKEYDTEYIENTELCVDYTSLNNKILLQEENKFVTQNNQELNSEQQLIYKQTKLNKNNIISVLGEDFNIKILKSDNTLIKEITKDIECLEDGTIIIDYEEEIDKINIETSKPYQEGTLTIENKKCIKSTMKNPNADKIKLIQSLTLLESNMTAEVTQKENEIVDSIPNASINLNNNSFTNEIQNDVTFSVSLKNKSSKDSLFTNPSIEIILPQEVEKIIVENVAVLYGNGLEKQNVEILTNKDGNKVISIKLIGEQTDYIFDTLKNETNIVIKAKIILKQDILSTDSNIKTICKNTIIKNEKEIIQETELNNIDINIISEYQTSDNNQDKVDTQGAIDLSNTDNKVPQKKISNINIEDLKNQKALDVETYAQVGSKKLSDGDTLHEKEVIKYVVKVKNNTSDDINNISIIGDIPQNTSYATVDIGSYFAEDYSYIQDKSATNYNFRNR